MSRHKWYIAGSIENNPDFGMSSRETIRKLLNDLDIAYFCPALSEANLRQIKKQESLKKIMQDKDSTWQDLLKERISPIVDQDIKGLVSCSGVIVILDSYVGTGTGSEVTLARYLDMPVLGIFIKDQDPREVHPWTLSRVDLFSENLRELRDALIEWEK